MNTTLRKKTNFNQIKIAMEIIYNISIYDNDGNFVSFSTSVDKYQNAIDMLKDFFLQYSVRDLETIHMILFSNAEEEINSIEELEEIIIILKEDEVDGVGIHHS